MDDPNAKSLWFLESVENSNTPIVVRLSQSPIDDEANELLLSSIVESSFDGYNPVVLELEPCAVPNDEWAEVASQEVVFTNGENVTDLVIYFAYATYQTIGGVQNLLQVYVFPEPIHLNAPYQEISTGAWRLKQTD